MAHKKNVKVLDSVWRWKNKLMYGSALTPAFKHFFTLKILYRKKESIVIIDCQRRCIQNPFKNLGWSFLLNVANYNYFRKKIYFKCLIGF